MLRRPILVSAIIALAACGGGSSGGASPAAPPLTGWAAVRAAAQPQSALPAEFGVPQVQPLAVDGWEDGIWISRDGLHLFCVYAPADLLSLVLNDPTQTHPADFLRGPTFGMDLTGHPVGGGTWIHGDILHATRASTAASFTTWQLSALARPFYSEGAAVAIDPGAGWGIFVYTTNEVSPYKAQICMLRNTASDPSGVGTILPTVNTVGLTSDNPHIERVGGTLVLFFDSDRPGGAGALDVYYSTSSDDGVTWAAPAAVTSVNTASDDHQPHLWQDGGGNWWLYFTATNPADSKLGIYRAAKGADWNSWGTRTLVVGAGNTAGVGEPSLTTAGDLSFVVITQDTVNGTATNRFDGDPWMALRVPSGVTARPSAAAALASVLGR